MALSLGCGLLDSWLSLRGVPADPPAAPQVPAAQCGIQTPHAEPPVVALHWGVFTSSDSATCSCLPEAPGRRLPGSRPGGGGVPLADANSID